ncbi:hypothetical protein CONCODRAFT_19816 [Conidiobolus coronatus NRRL 28638]|uniref:Zn(2)-C6 fungal-type domain-containing protein n=1 Tax=Conidiobolus coronatus (strain ATCC 28846 / CBS 209.66 / NRRL 28638) TaxID=796925 RepID=A0A137NWX2_CONC2|nr:hypothetical protein CONCODRAFT_19816 [Conidiobolus coronatus NRRL 28638]|eukprot:KXN67139.1 hypothetical protein CONCODRAFT_19816 [Conidiobolus coronatus NRRL 28638]
MTVSVKSTSISNQKLNKSCSKCRTSKLKCSGGSPCERSCKPRSKPVITKPKFHRLLAKEKRINSLFDKVDEHYQLKKYSNFYSVANNLSSSSSTSDIEKKGGIFEFLITRNLKELYLQVYSNNFSNIEKINFKQDLVVIPTLQNAKQQFFKLLFQLYETSSCYIFTYKAFEEVLQDKNWINSLLANAIFGMGLRIYQAQNEEPPGSPNPFYERARYLFSRITNVNTLECAQVLLIFSYTEFALGLFSKSTYSVNQAQSTWFRQRVL